MSKITSHKFLGKIWVGFINKGKVNNILFPDMNVQVKELETKYRWMLKLLICFKQQNNLRINVKISKQLGRLIRQSKPHIGKIDNIHHQDKLGQLYI